MPYAICVIIRKLSFCPTCLHCRVKSFKKLLKHGLSSHLSIRIITCLLQCVLSSFKIQSHALYLFFSPQTFTSLMVRAREDNSSRENRDEGGKGAVSVFWRYMDQGVFGNREKEIKNALQRSLGQDLTKTNLSEKTNNNWQTIVKGSLVKPTFSNTFSPNTKQNYTPDIKIQVVRQGKGLRRRFLVTNETRKRQSQQQDPLHSSLAATLTVLRSRNRKKTHAEHNQTFLYSWCIFMSPAFPAQLLLAVKLSFFVGNFSHLPWL